MVTSIEVIQEKFPRDQVHAVVEQLLKDWYVLCSVTGERIPLPQLKYWHVDTQRCFKNAEAALVAHEKRNLEK